MSRLCAAIIALLAVSSSTAHAQQQYDAAAFELTPEDRAQAVHSSTAPAVTGAAITQELINSINSDQSLSWIGTLENKFSSWTESEVKAILGLKPIETGHRFGFSTTQEQSQSYTGYDGEALPTQFDARQQWAERCPSVAQVMDQAGCGSCWAVSAAEVMSDRICIASNATYTPVLSSADLMSNCGQLCGSGCQGGTLEGAWSYFQQTGVVDGGEYGAKDACYPYVFPPCSHHGGAAASCQERQTPPGQTTCNNGNDWLKSKWYGHQASQINGVVNMMREIYYHGPIQVGFNVHSDFLSYTKGVYRYKSGNQLGGHAVKIVGWGETSSGDKFWTVVNSWNSDWGVGGSFAIARGTDECGIEDMAWAGEPRLS